MAPRNKQKQVLMTELRDEVFALTTSPLYAERTKHNACPVIGEGDLNASIMFIGEAPGKNEALTGKPFCGASGKILDELLASINLPRESVYVTNIAKDRPPLNRDPTPEEITAYGPFLDRQINIIEPKVLATLGRYSMKYIMERFSLFKDLGPISELHGKTFKAKTNYGEITIVPLYHPAVAVYNNKTKDTLKTDFAVLKEFLAS